MLDTSIAERCDGRFAGGREFAENPWFDTSLGLRGHKVAGKKQKKREQHRARVPDTSQAAYISFTAKKIFFKFFFQ